MSDIWGEMGKLISKRQKQQFYKIHSKRPAMKLFTNAFLWILWNFPEQLFSKILRDVCFWISFLGWLSEAPFPNSNETVPFFLWNIEILKEFF